MSESENSGFEETDAELDSGPLDAEAKGTLRDRWESRQADLLSHSVDFTAATFVELVDRGDLDLNPEFERRDRWSLDRRSRLIESFLLNIPVPPVFLSESDFGQYTVIDGRHRISALVGFVHDDYPLTGLDILFEANGKTFSELDMAMRRSLLSRTVVRAVILDRLSDPDMKYEVFARLNTGGVPLNAQELRNAVFPGPFNRLTVELSELPEFRDALTQGNASYSRLWSEMRDVELVLRYFALAHNSGVYGGAMSRALSETLWTNNQLTPEGIERERQDFISTLNKCHAAFGNLIFRRWRPEQNSVSPRISVSLYEAEMIAVRDFAEADLSRNANEIQEGLRQLFTYGHFLESLRFGTYTPHSLQMRIGFVRELLENTLAQA